MNPPCGKDVSRNVLKACSHLFGCSSPIPHGQSQCHPVSYFYINIYLSLFVKWGGWTGGSLSAYVITNHLWTHKIGLNDPRPCKKVSKGNHFKPDQIKKKSEPDAAKCQSFQGHFAMLQAWLSDTIPFTISDTKWFCLQSHLFNSIIILTELSSITNSLLASLIWLINTSFPIPAICLTPHCLLCEIVYFWLS